MDNPFDFLLLIITAMLVIVVLRFVLPVVLYAFFVVLLAAYELLVLVPFKWLGKWLRRNRWPKPQPRYFVSAPLFRTVVVVKKPVSFRVHQEASK